MTNHWEVVTLKNVLEHKNNFIKITDDELYKRCRVQIDAKGVILRDKIYGGSIRIKKQQVCDPGDFLVAEIDAKVGGYGVVPMELKGAIVSSHYFLYKINEDLLDVNLLKYYIKTPIFRQQIKAQGSTNYASIRPNDVLEYTIPLPSLEQQKILVSYLKNMESKIITIKNHNKSIKEKLNHILPSLLPLFSKKQNYRYVNIGEIATINSESRNPSIKNPDGYFQYIDISSVDSGTGKILNVKNILGINAPSRARRVVKEGDVIMSTVRPYLKSFTKITKEYDNQICSTGFAVLTPKSSVLQDYLLISLFSDETIKQCNDVMVGAHYPALRINQVKNIVIPLPNINMQKYIVDLYYKLFDKVNVVMKLLNINDVNFHNLFESYLYHIFNNKSNVNLS